MKNVNVNDYSVNQPSYKFMSRSNENINEILFKQFIRIMQSMTEYEGLPDTIPKHLLERYLLENGWTFITQVEDKGLYALMGGLGGELNAYYMPTLCVVANPYLKYSAELKIGIDGVLCMNDSYLQGVGEILGIYTNYMSHNLRYMILNAMHKSIPGFMQAGDSNVSESAELFYKKLYEGMINVINGTTIYDSLKSFPFNSGNNDLKDLIEYHQYITSLAYNACGLDASFNMKREYVGSHETSINHAALHAFTDDMMLYREKFCKEVNEMYGTKIKVRMASGWKLDREIENLGLNKNVSFSERSENNTNMLSEDEERLKLIKRRLNDKYGYI